MTRFEVAWLIASSICFASADSLSDRPNVILVMADDLGYGDVSYLSKSLTRSDGSPHPDQGWIQTPALDEMAANGLRFDRFYSASAVCSPTRASCLTGRNPFRVGVPYANEGSLGRDESTLPEVLQKAGYRTGHFGKWHLGTLTTLRKDANRARPGFTEEYSAPWHHGYDECFVTESKVPTFHPYRKPKNSLALPKDFSDPNFYGTRFWEMPENPETAAEGRAVPPSEINDADNGDSSKLTTDRALDFIQALRRQ